MKKKIFFIVILIFFIVLLITIPIATLGKTMLGTLLYEPNNNENTDTNLHSELHDINFVNTTGMEENAFYTNETINNKNISISSNKTINTEIAQSVDDKQELEKFENNLESIIIKYTSPETYNELMSRIEYDKNNTISYNSIPQSNKDFYILVLEIIENNNLSEFEEKTLKEFLSNVYYNIIEDAELSQRFQNIIDI